MPFKCGTCAAVVERDEGGCPACAAPKTHWTIVQDKTRTFRMSGKRVAYLRGERHATRAPTLEASVACALANRQEAPDPLDVLTVRLFPKGHPDWTVRLTIELEAAEAAQRAFPRAAPDGFAKDGHHDVRFLFVHGPSQQEVELLELPGVDHVVDITEGDGKAPWLELTALGKPVKRLPTSPGGEYLINARLFDATGRVPVRELDGTLAGRACSTDGEGLLYLEDVEPGRHLLELAGGTIDVPASHHRDYVIAVRLPFHQATEADLEAHARPMRKIDEDAEDAPGWLPAIDPREVQEDADATPYEEGHGDPDHPALDEEYQLNARFFDRTGRVPVANATCTLDGQERTTDDLGVLRVERVGPGRHDVTFEGGVVDVSASHHPDYVVDVRLPFHEAASDELEAFPRQGRPTEPDRDDGAPTWLPVDPAEAPLEQPQDPRDPPATRDEYERVHGERARGPE